MIQRQLVPNANTTQAWQFPEGSGPALLLCVYTEFVRDVLAGSGAFLLLEFTNRDGVILSSSVIINSALANGERSRCTVGFDGSSFPQGLNDGAGNSWWACGMPEAPMTGGEQIRLSLVNGIPSVNDIWESTMVSFYPTTAEKKAQAPRTPRDQLEYGCKLYKR